MKLPSLSAPWAIVIGAALILTACGRQNILWHPPSGTDGRQYNKDRLVCRGVSGFPAQTAGGGGVAGLLMDLGAQQESRDDYVQCMKDAGYTPEYR